MNSRAYRGMALAALIFLLVQLGALALVPTFYEQGFQTVEDPSNPVNSLVYIGAILVVTVLMLAAFKYDLHWAVRGVIVFTSAMLSWYVFAAVVPVELHVGGVNVLPLLLAGGVGLALYFYPEWYVIDAAGVLMGAGAAALFGISFGLLPALVLLGFLAVYDAVSVYGTEHMLDLASGVMRLRIPVVLVVPLSLSYSLLDEEFEGEGESDDADADAGAGGARGSDAAGDRGDGSADAATAANGGRADAETDDAGGADAGDGTDPDGGGEETDRTEGVSIEDRDVFFIGLGDAVMPTVMVASAAFFAPEAAASLGVSFLPALNLPALLAMVGTFVGLGVLLRAVLKGRPHAGLPLLNGGAIGGYLLGSVLAGVPLAEAVGLARYL